jgi:signal transduction histidine kinase
LLQVDCAVLSRYDVDGGATVVGGWERTDPGRPLALGVQLKPDGRNIHALVFEDRQPARIDDYGHATGDLGELARDWGFRSAVGVPITVEDDLWGVMIAGSQSGPLAANTEVRLVGFTELLAAALANAQAQAALTASRARIVAADATARRRLERNLHDGAQQHLVALALQVREVQATAPPEARGLGSQLDEVATGMASVLDELREIGQGIHPAGLSEGGLRQTLITLADRSAVPVRLDVHAGAEIPERVGVAAYYVVAESLANAAKYADASIIYVRVRVFDEQLLISVRDDGRGGADLAGGSGLVGLQDRVEALGGRLSLRSPTGAGTAVDISLPLSGRSPGDVGVERSGPAAPTIRTARSHRSRERNEPVRPASAAPTCA